MGSPLSPVIANLFLEDLETRALGTYHLKPSLWLRYVDDTFVIWPHGRQSLDLFLDHLNSLHPKIEFTMEVEENNRLAFLDVLVIKKEDGTLAHTVHRKATHTNRYLHASSHHHPSQISSIPKTLVQRSRTIADQEHLGEELTELRQALDLNGYSNSEINRAFNWKPRNTVDDIEEDKIEDKKKAHLPYVKGVTDRIGRILGKQNISTIFKPHKKIGSLFTKEKEMVQNERQGVYEVPCGSCNKTYIGQTNRKVSHRIKEHEVAVKNHQKTSTLAQHVEEKGHVIDFVNARTIAVEERFLPRIMREAIEIERNPDTLNNRDDGKRLPPQWKLALKKYKRTPRSTTLASEQRPTTVSKTTTLTGRITRSQTAKLML